MEIIIGIILSLILAFIGYKKNKFTNFGLFVATIISITIYICGGLPAFISFVSLFIITVITDSIKKNYKRKIEDNINEKSDKRDCIQVLANLLPAIICIVLYKILNNNIFYILYITSLAISASDTSASGIGVLSKKTYNIISLNESQKGLSGNISILGCGSSLISSFLISLTILIEQNNIVLAFIISIIGFVGALFDSILGCAQVKYKCNKCKIITERTIHCNKKTEYYSGLKLLNNDLVNLLSNSIVIIIMYLTFFVR